MARRQPGLLAEIRCPRRGHLLGVLYATREGVRLQARRGAVLSDHVIDPPQPGLRHATGTGAEPGPSGVRHACRCGGYAAPVARLREATAEAYRDDKVIRIIARPESGRW